MVGMDGCDFNTNLLYITVQSCHAGIENVYQCIHNTKHALRLPELRRTPLQWVSAGVERTFKICPLTKKNI